MPPGSTSQKNGAPALSLRAIARDLKITAPAIYNYFPDRDALVTALIIDAYTSFGDSQLAARDEVPPDDLVGRMNAIGLAYRQWAHKYPQRYQLIFGTPIPGYQTPIMEVMPSAARSLSVLVSVVEQLRLAGKLKIKSFPKVKAEFKVDLRCGRNMAAKQTFFRFQWRWSSGRAFTGSCLSKSQATCRPSAQAETTCICMK